MKICSLLDEAHVFLALEPGDKKKVLEDLVGAVRMRGWIKDDKHILDELLKRESLGSTGLERGLAVPHALVEEIEQPFLALAVFPEGIDFEAADGEPTYLVMLLLGSKKDPGTQLKILAHVCRLVKETRWVERARKADSPRRICEILEEEEGKIV